jgi:DNA-binding LacI/PurR family transcriptional regulator
VSPHRRDRVLRAAAELSYVPLPAAVRLSSGRGRTVGVVLPAVSRWFFVEVVVGAARALRQAGYDLQLHDVPPADEQGNPEASALRGRVDALLLIASAGTDGDLDAWRHLGVPLVVVGGRPGTPARVGVDDRAGAATATRHLLQLGHREVRMIAGTVDSAFDGTASRERQAGFTETLAEAGIGTPDDGVVRRPWGVEGGAAAMAELLEDAARPTAIFAESDELAFGALHVLRRRGLRVPEDVSVIGFDDHEMAAPWELTTIAQPVAEQGRAAAAMLLDLMAGGSPGGEVLLPTRLVVRGTTAPPGG